MAVFSANEIRTLMIRTTIKKIPGFKGIISHKVNSAAGVMTAQISDNNGLIFAGNFRACPENC